MASTILGIGALCCVPLVCASITVYSQQPFAGTATGTANVVAYTGAAAYDPTILIPPPIPNPPPPMQFTQHLSSIPPPGVSIPQSGHFYGFSVEFSVLNQICGPNCENSGNQRVPWLNLMSNMQARGGSVRVRIGGNTQETATLVSSLPDDKMMEKVNTTDDPLEMLTPPLLYTPEVIYMLANISALVNVQWYLGIPLNDTQHLRLAIAEVAEKVLGDNVLGFQVGNEPDQYAIHNHRPITYGPEDYSDDFGVVEAAMRADPNISSVVGKLIGPSVSGNWKLEDIWATGFLDLYEDSLAALSVEYYPNNNCAKVLNSWDAVVDPQKIFSDYLNHTAAQIIVNKYLPSTLMAQSLDLPFLMFETNSASCGGFAGISDSFASALWALDYGLQLAYSNFTGALLHIGGQGDYYNSRPKVVDTAPPTNQSVYRDWTIGPIYYSALIVQVAEVFGKSNESRIIDLQLNDENIFTPGYAIYDKGILSRLALINYITDPSGSSDYTATFSFDDGQTPSQVEVKYLVAASVSSKNNITWAGQTFGSNFESDGRLNGILDVQTIPCDTSARTCSVRVPAPGFGLVFFNDFADQVAATPTAATWPTTAYTRTASISSVAPSLLATSNGHWGMDERLGSTSPGRKWWLEADGPHRRNGTHKNGALTRQEGGGKAFIIAGIILLGLCL
ncbi:glycoside hydrolase family 79 protein [Mycena metata]|uniref:Glycoside hydrolase family 79 protein n=1 Tax=Mycena metata TaxID=1033252 RepID=A0AAD7N4M3_9AGAR|nr:glycoside hydrolase family 79 protein [Mycena metata]